MSSYSDLLRRNLQSLSATSLNTTAHDTILNGGTHESLVKISVKTV